MDEHLHQRYISWLLTLAGVGLLVLSMLMPPQGEIHPSVLAAFGMILTFVGTVMGIDYNYKKALGLQRPKDEDKPKKETGDGER